jgi:hypothetical protein
MKRKVGEIWKEQEGSKRIWKVQFPSGILSCKTKKDAENFVKAFKLDN